MNIDASSPSLVTGNPTATTAPFTPPDNSVLVVGWAGNSGTGELPPMPTVTDNLGAHLSYILVDHRSAEDDPIGHPDGQAAMWTAAVTVGASMTVSVTNNSTAATHGALRVWVVTNALVGTGGSGGNGFSTTTVSQSYTATADSSQGFMAICDWDTTGTQTAGTGCTEDPAGSISGQISYAFPRRTAADGTNGATTTLISNLPSSSVSLNWVYVELVPLVGDPPEKDPPPFVWSHPPGDGISPNGVWSPWSGTADAAPTDTGLRISETSPEVALNIAGTATGTATSTFRPPSGSMLLVLWAGNSGAGVNPSTPTITDSLGVPLTYTLRDWQSRADAAGRNGQAAIWTAPVVTGAPMSVTVNNNAASPTRQAALQVLVVTNQDSSTPVGAHGKAGSASVSMLDQTYTASATLGQGFAVMCDWTVVGTAKAGQGCYQAAASSLGTIAGQIGWGMIKRLVPDDVSSQSNLLRFHLPGTSTEANWAYIEILPAAVSGGSAETGSTPLGLTAAGSAVKSAAQTGACTLAAVGSGSARKTATAATTAQLCVRADATAVKAAPQAGVGRLALAATGTETTAAARQQTGTTTVAAAAAGRAAKTASVAGRAQAALRPAALAAHGQTGTAEAVLRAAATAVKVVSQAGTTTLAVTATGRATKTAPTTGRAEVALRTAGLAAHGQAGAAELATRTAAAAAKLVSRTGTAEVALRTAATAAKAAPQAGTARAALTSGGAETSGTARQQTGTCTIAVAGTAAARKAVSRTGASAVAVSAAAAARKSIGCAGRALVTPRPTGAATKRATATATATVVLTTVGVETTQAARAQSGTTAIPLRAAATGRKVAPQTTRVLLVTATTGLDLKRAVAAGRAGLAVLPGPVVTGIDIRLQTGVGRLALNAPATSIYTPRWGVDGTGSGTGADQGPAAATGTLGAATILTGADVGSARASAAEAATTVSTVG